jgi:hypothetical protein
MIIISRVSKKSGAQQVLADPQIRELLEQWIEQQQQLQQELTELQHTYDLEL